EAARTIADRTQLQSIADVNAGRNPLRDASGELYPLANAYLKAITQLAFFVGPEKAKTAPPGTTMQQSSEIRCKFGLAGREGQARSPAANAAVLCERNVWFEPAADAAASSTSPPKCDPKLALIECGPGESWDAKECKCK